MVVNFIESLRNIKSTEFLRRYEKSENGTKSPLYERYEKSKDGTKSLVPAPSAHWRDIFRSQQRAAYVAGRPISTQRFSVLCL